MLHPKASIAVVVRVLKERRASLPSMHVDASGVWNAAVEEFSLLFTTNPDDRADFVAACGGLFQIRELK